ncbi:MAG: hypothetical protein M3Z54_03140 [Gemmatimonadota bacterium]|nr:hypothetical protein [Gemmatimonadota bacterium]
MIAAPHTLTAFRERWLARRDELRALHALVDGAELCDKMVTELDDALRAEHSAVLSLREASRASGYSPDHLGRLIRTGVLRNAGRPNAPKIRLADLPKKPIPSGRLTLAPLIGKSRVQIARSVVTSMKEHDHD